MLVPEFVGPIALRLHMNKQLRESREYPYRIYSNVAFSAAQIVPEIPSLASLIYLLVVNRWMQSPLLGLRLDAATDMLRYLGGIQTEP